MRRLERRRLRPAFGATLVLVLAAPVIATAKVLGEHLPRLLRPLGEFLGG